MNEGWKRLKTIQTFIPKKNARKKIEGKRDSSEKFERRKTWE